MLESAGRGVDGEYYQNLPLVSSDIPFNNNSMTELTYIKRYRLFHTSMLLLLIQMISLLDYFPCLRYFVSKI